MAERLYRLKEWLTIPDAVEHLSIAFGQPVTEAELLQLALEGDLTLSVKIHHAWGWLGTVVPLDQAQHLAGVLVSETVVLHLSEPRQFLEVVDGVWDLGMCGNELLEIQRRYESLTGGSRVITLTPYGAIVNRPDGTWLQLVKDATSTGERSDLPDDAVFVVRTAVLDELVRRTPAQADSKLPKPTGERPTETRPADVVAADGPPPEPFDIAAQDLETMEGRRKAIEAFLADCNSHQRHTLKNHHIWKAMGYKKARQFQYWMAAAGPNSTARCGSKVRQILAQSPADFVALLSRKGIEVD